MPEDPSEPSAFRCMKCKEVKPSTEFSRNKSTGTGFHFYCKPCHSRQRRESLARNYGGSQRHYHLKQRYGIGAAEVDELIRQQGGFCAVCGVREAKQVDHDHTTGEVRGIVCLLCNAAMGALP
jgi:Recombination endonuclease VII